MEFRIRIKIQIETWTNIYWAHCVRQRQNEHSHNNIEAVSFVSQWSERPDGKRQQKRIHCDIFLRERKKFNFHLRFFPSPLRRWGGRIDSIRALIWLCVCDWWPNVEASRTEAKEGKTADVKQYEWHFYHLFDLSRLRIMRMFAERDIFLEWNRPGPRRGPANRKENERRSDKVFTITVSFPIEL